MSIKMLTSVGEDQGNPECFLKFHLSVTNPFAMGTERLHLWDFV